MHSTLKHKNHSILHYHIFLGTKSIRFFKNEEQILLMLENKFAEENAMASANITYIKLKHIKVLHYTIVAINSNNVKYFQLKLTLIPSWVPGGLSSLT